MVRLAGGRGMHEGRLEIYFQEEWGTVCQQKGWNYGKLPQTVCKQIGLSGGTSSLTMEYGAGTGRIWLEGVRCNGDETRIDSCNSSAWGAVKCDHSMDIGIRCDGMVWHVL